MEPGGQFDFQQILAAASQVQSQLADAQQRLADTRVEGTAGGGLVKVILDGQGEIVDLVISPDAIDTDDPAECAQTLADLVLAACRDASRAASELQEDMMGPLASVLGQVPGGMPAPGGPGGPGLAGLPGFPGFPGLPGAPPPARPPARPADPGEPGDAEGSGGSGGH